MIPLFVQLFLDSASVSFLSPSSHSSWINLRGAFHAACQHNHTIAAHISTTIHMLSCTHRTETQVKWFVSFGECAVCCQLSECLIAPLEYVWRNWLCCIREKLIMNYGWIFLSHAVMKFCWVISLRITLFTDSEDPWVVFSSVFELCNYFF